MAALLLEDYSIDDVRRESQTKGGGKVPLSGLLNRHNHVFAFIVLQKSAFSLMCGYFYEGGI